MTISDTGLRIVLASGSPRRRELLTGLGIPFDVVVSHTDESVDEPLQPPALVEELAWRKAAAVANRCRAEACLVIGADTIVVVDGQVLGKPGSEAEAVDMLRRLQGRTHDVFTGLCVIHAQSGERQIGHSRTRVRMARLSDETICRYVASGEPMDKAGAYAIQGLGSVLVESLEGDYFTVVGLPLVLLARYLGSFGVNVL